MRRPCAEEAEHDTNATALRTHDPGDGYAFRRPT